MGEMKEVVRSPGHLQSRKGPPRRLRSPLGWRPGGEGRRAGGGRPRIPGAGLLHPSSAEARLHGLVARLQEVLSPGAVAEEGPTRPVCPSGEEEVAAALRLAAEHRVPVRPVGQGLEKGEEFG
jgi:hypothetical protein